MSNEKMSVDEVLAALLKSARAHYDGTHSGRMAEEHANEAMNNAAKLFSDLTRRIAELTEVTDSMVERACEGYLQEAKRQNFNPSEEWARSQQARDWMRAALIAARCAGAERDAIINDLDSLREDAERWRHARQILIVDQIEAGQSDYENWVACGGQVDEEESKRADAAIDVARANEST